MNTIIKEVHISTIKQGDTVIWNGQLTTIGKNDIKRSDFMGHTLFGDSHKLGTIPIKKVLFKVPTNNGIVYR